MAETLATISPEVLAETANWISTNLRPVAQLMADEGIVETQAAEAPPAQLELRDCQVASWASVWNARQEGRARGEERTSALLELATGLGKTTVIVGDFKKYCEEREQENLPPPRGLFVSHRHAINKQAQERFELFMDDLELGSSTTPEEMSSEPPVPRLDLVTIQTLFKRLLQIDPQLYDYIAWDEAHHTMAETYAQVVRHLRPAFELAVTATPIRMDEKEISDHFGEAVYRKVLAEAIADRSLAQVDYHMVFDSTIQAALQDGGSVESLKDLRKLFEEKPPLDAVARDIQAERHKLGLDTAKTLIFCENIKEADELAELLGCEAYHSLKDDADQIRIMEEYKANPNGVLCTVDKFNEGVDVPDIRLVVFNRATESITVFEQQLGRGLRLYEGKDRVTVLDFTANIKRIALVRQLSEEVRRSLRDNAREGGRDAPETEDEWAGDDPTGVAIHTGGNNFIFSRMVVDVLETFDRLSMNSYLSADIMSLYTAARELQVRQPVLEEKVAEMGWILPNHRFGPKTAPSITRLQITELQTRFPDTFAPKAPKDYYSIKSAAKKLELDYYTVKRLVAELATEYEWELPRYRFGGTAADGISPDQFALLKNHPDANIPSADDTIIALKGLAKKLKTSEDMLRDLARKAEPPIPITLYKFSSTPGAGVHTDHVPALTAAREALIIIPPPGYLSNSGFAQAIGVHALTVKTVVKEKGWELPEYTFGNYRTGGLSPGQQEELKTHPRIQALMAKRQQDKS